MGAGSKDGDGAQGALPEAFIRFVSEIDEKLIVAEAQLQLLGRIKQSENLEITRADLDSILLTNSKIEHECPCYADKIQRWGELDGLTPTEVGELDHVFVRVKRLSVVSENIVQLSKSYLQFQDLSRVKVDEFIEKMKKS